MKIGLDIDGVLCCFVGGVLTRASELGIRDKFPAKCTDVDHWNISEAFPEVWKTLGDDAEFWLKLRPLPYTTPLHFQPDCYITSRRIPSWVTEQWLGVNRFPKADVISVAYPHEKLPHVLERRLDVFIDDHWETVREMRANGVNAILYEAPYQRGHDVSDLPKIKHLSEVNSELLRNSKQVSIG